MRPSITSFRTKLQGYPFQITFARGPKPNARKAALPTIRKTARYYVCGAHVWVPMVWAAT